jgi:hypothetical protein
MMPHDAASGFDCMGIAEARESLDKRAFSRTGTAGQDEKSI